MLANFGERLKNARKMAGLSMEALAKKAEDLISKQAIGKYEKGKMKPSGEVLMALSRALGVKPDYFFRFPSVRLSNLEFRKKSSLRVKEQNRIKHKALDFLERYFEIEDILETRVAFKNPIPSKNRQVLNISDVENAAMTLRNKWDLGTAPVTNLMELLEHKGVRIFEIETNDKFHGISAWADEIPVIAVRAQDGLVRKRFTIAHEFGHILLDFNPDEDPKAGEKLCHEFAGAFLLPEIIIKAELGEHRGRIALLELKKLKGIYGISIQAIMDRAERLGIISAYNYKNFCIMVNRRGWKKDEPGSYERKERANRLKQLVYHAAAEDIITFSRAAELLNMPLSELRKIQIVS